MRTGWHRAADTCSHRIFLDPISLCPWKMKASGGGNSGVLSHCSGTSSFCFQPALVILLFLLAPGSELTCHSPAPCLPLEVVWSLVYFFGLDATCHNLTQLGCSHSVFLFSRPPWMRLPAPALSWSAQHPAKFILRWLLFGRRAYMSTRYLPRGSWEEGWERFSFECMFVRVNCSSSISSFQWREGKCQACVKWFVQSSSVAFSLLKLIVDFHSYNAHFTVWYQASMEMIFGVSEKRIFANVLGHKLAPE